jgi:predicted lysophospholipase L1 biosynthesis ABC-type transport system permease subunit
MIYPEGINAAYFAGDTTNVLNASAFRISYIPKFINAINITSISLTLFIILLSLVICAIVIHRYITNQQSILGIMKANGISNTKIATSILPIAIIPALFGTIFGAIIGTLLQLPVLGLFSNY